MKQIGAIFFLIAILITGCNRKFEGKIDQYFFETKCTTIKSKKIIFEKNQMTLDFMFEMLFFDSLIFLNEFPDPQYCMKIANLRTGEIFPFAEKGRGPGQMNGQSVDFSLDYKNHLLYLTDKNKYFIYSIDSIIKYHEATPSINQFSFRFDDGSFMRTVYNKGCIVGRMFEKEFGLYKINDNEIIKTGNYKKGDALVNQSFFVSHPTKDIVAYFNYSSLGMGLLNLYNGSVIEEKKIFEENSEMKTKKEGNAIHTYREKGARNGFIAATSSNQYLYVIYSGKVIDSSSIEALTSSFLSNKVYVFDWNGNPVRQFKLDCNVRSIAVDFNDQILYAASYNEKEPCLISIDIDNIMHPN